MGGERTFFHKYPFIKQQSINDCGIACLMMILNYHHGHVNYDYLHDLTNTSTKGTTAYHLIEAAKKLGFKAYGIRLEIDNINQMILPAIVHLKLEHGYHYVVVYKIDKKEESIIIADPADKIKKYSFLEFSTIWTGVMIILHPKTNLKYIDDTINIKKLLYPCIKKYFSILVKIFGLSLILGFIYYITSFYAEWLLNDINTNQSKSYLIILSAVMFFCYMIKNITDYIRNHILAFLTRRIQLLLTNDIIRRLISLPFSYYERRTTGEVVSKVSDFLSIQNFVQRIFIYISFDLVLLVISLIVLLTLYSQIFYIQILFLVADIVIMFCLNNYYAVYNADIQNNKDIFTNTITSMIMGYESIKGIGVEENVLENFLGAYHKMVKNEENYSNLLFFHNFSQNLLHDISYIAQMLLTSFLIINNEFEITSFFTYQLFSGYFLQYTTSGIYIFRDYKNIKEIFRRISFLFIPPQIIKDNNQIINNISFCNFTFGYEDDLFQPFSFKINHGNKILLCGNSGSGKSTILKSIMGYHELKRGLIYFNDIDINDYSKDDIKKNITYVNQNGLLFTDSLYYNLTLNRNVTSEQLFEVIKLCHINQIMDKHNMGLNMWIGENGQNLSGGERQRIILARALLNNFQILLLDEATNQMDEQLEKDILTNILNKYKDQIIIIISHHQTLSDRYNYVVQIRNNEVVINEH